MAISSVVRLRKTLEDCGFCSFYIHLVGVVLHRQFPVGVFDLALVCCSLHAQQLIEVAALAFHGSRHQNVLFL